MNPSCKLIKQIHYKGYTINVICGKLSSTKNGLIYHERYKCTISGVYDSYFEPLKSIEINAPRLFNSIYSAKKYINDNLIKEKNNG